MSYLITIPSRSINCDSVKSLPLLLTSSAVAEAIIHRRPPCTSSVLCWMDGCVNKNRLSILSYAINSSFFSSYVDSERNHHHFHLLAVEHERWIYHHISISQGYLLKLLFLFARRRSEPQFSMILSTTRPSMSLRLLSTSVIIRP